MTILNCHDFVSPDLAVIRCCWNDLNDRIKLLFHKRNFIFNINYLFFFIDYFKTEKLFFFIVKLINLFRKFKEVYLHSYSNFILIDVMKEAFKFYPAFFLKNFSLGYNLKLFNVYASQRWSKIGRKGSYIITFSIRNELFLELNHTLLEGNVILVYSNEL